MYVNDIEGARRFFEQYISAISNNLYHNAFSVGSKEKVDLLTAQMKKDEYHVVSGPRTTGDGYYESCVVVVEGNQIEITV